MVRTQVVTLKKGLAVEVARGDGSTFFMQSNVMEILPEGTIGERHLVISLGKMDKDGVHFYGLPNDLRVWFPETLIEGTQPRERELTEAEKTALRERN